MGSGWQPHIFTLPLPTAGLGPEQRGLKLREAFGANVWDWAPTRCLGRTCFLPLPAAQTFPFLIDVPIGFGWTLLCGQRYAGNPFKEPPDKHKQNEKRRDEQNICQIKFGSLPRLWFHSKAKNPRESVSSGAHCILRHYWRKADVKMILIKTWRQKAPLTWWVKEIRWLYLIPRQVWIASITSSRRWGRKSFALASNDRTTYHLKWAIVQRILSQFVWPNIYLERNKKHFLKSISQFQSFSPEDL